MTYYVADNVYDESLAYLKAQVTLITVCQGAPANYTEATDNLGVGSGKKLADVTVVTGDFTIAPGTSDGRKVTVGAQNGVVIDVNGDADHVAWVDVANTALLAVTQLTATQTGLVAANTLNIPAHAINIRAATASP